MHGDCFTIFNQPGALLHLHFIEKLSINDRRMALQANSEAPSLDIHHHVFPLQPEAHLERDGQLDQTKIRFEELSNASLSLPSCATVLRLSALVSPEEDRTHDIFLAVLSEQEEKGYKSKFGNRMANTSSRL